MPKSAPSFASDLRLLETFWKQPPVRTVLANGLTLLVQRDTSAPVASVQVWVKTGSIHEGGLLGAGLSHYLEHLLFKGTERRAGREISTTVQEHGGNINAYTTFDRTVYYIDLPSDHVGVALDVLADAVLHSTLPADEVAREKDVILREIAMGNDDPDHRLGEALFDTAFRQHPYRYPIIGYKDVFTAVTRDDLVAYYKARYVPNNLVVVVAGDVDVAAVQALVETHFGSAPRAKLASVLVLSEPPQLAPRALHRHEDVELTRAGLSWQIPGLTHADAPVLDLLGVLLGQGDSSVLWQAIREKARLVHSIDATCWNPGETGLFYVSFICESKHREAATKAVRRELDRVAAQGFAPALIRKALRQLVVGEINTRKTMSGQASRLGAAEVVAGDVDFSKTYFARIARVTTTDLRRAVRTYLGADRVTEVSLNPKNNAPVVSTAAGVDRVSDAFTEHTLANGARLLLRPDRRLPNLHLRLLCEGGPVHEPAALRGATSLMATLLTKDTKKRTAAEVARFIEEVGGSFYPFSGNNSFGLAAEVLPGDYARALEAMADAVLAPAFAKATFEIERDAQLADLQQDADDVVTVGRKLVRRKFFGTHPLAIDSHGTIEGIKALKAADLSALWKRLGVSGNVVLVAAGAFDPKVLTPKLKAFLARLPRGSAPVGTAKFMAPGEVGNFVEKQPREQAVVFQSFPGPGLKSADYYIGEVADELFSGMSSRLFERVREEKGLAYFVRSSRITGIDTGMFTFYAGTAPATADEVLVEIDAEIARVQAGKVEKTELIRCQTRLKAGRRMGLQTNGSRAMHAGLNTLYGLPVDDAATYDAHIDAVTIADLKAFAKQRFQKTLRTQLVVRP
ncbi:M16 family metallopeptidase [Rariglobus hedericola]|uniref:Insulinase family protein n=1 Tax=Rariglobus hedericola TaxID=2597822 RepID=A0A556QR00_9BACT|nr:pitrilysin family protein [Rariglobus hedericola]TSJ79068.1 insulinase family protein [Rariglobus hedericola]